MAAALLKNALLKTRPGGLKCSLPDPVSNARNQQKRFTRFTQPVYKKAKEIDEFSAPIVVSSQFSSRAFSSNRRSGLVGWYMGLLKTRPVATKCVTAGLIYIAADVSSQTIVRENLERYDLIRTMRMAGYGMLILGPSVHYWYNFMSRIFPKRDLLSTFKKMALGQATFGPSMTVIFLSVNAAMQGESGPEIVARLRRDLLPTLINGVMYWPVCDFLTFKFIPVHLQPLVTNSFSYLWTVYMTYMASLAKVDSS